LLRTVAPANPAPGAEAAEAAEGSVALPAFLAGDGDDDSALDADSIAAE
jgi:hypothetical protein